MAFIVLDTDVSSLIQKDRLPAALDSQLSGHSLCVSFVTVAELTQWAELRSWGPSVHARLDQWLSNVVVLPYNRRVSRAWGWLAASSRRRGRPRPGNDTWIAACCLVAGLPLATLNIKDFADFAEHEGLRLVAG